MPPDSLDRFLVQLRAKRSPRTTKTYGTVVLAFLAHLDPGGEPTPADVEAFLARREQKPAASSRNVELAALRSFGDFAVRELIWRGNPAKQVPFERVPATTPVCLSQDELHRFFFAASALPGLGRSRALSILGVLSQTGLRVHELVALNVGQVDLETATLLSVRGKGGTCHDLPLSEPACALLRAWLSPRASLAKPGEQALLVTRLGRRMSERSVQRLMARLCVAVGTGKHATPHSLRHTAATLALLGGTDLATVAELLRHERLETTQRYLHCIDTRRREAVRKLASAVPVEVLVPKKSIAIDAQDRLDVTKWLRKAA